MGEEAEFEKTNILRGLFPPTSIWADHDTELPKNFTREKMHQIKKDIQSSNSLQELNSQGVKGHDIRV